MRVERGLSRHTAYHEEWKQEVGWVWFDAPDGTPCVIDPLGPPPGSLVIGDGPAIQVLITVYWHTRDAGAWARELGATVWAPSGARSAVRRRAGVEPRTFRPGDELPAGIQAFATSRRSEVVYWLPSAKALVAGDAILGDDDGGLRLCPASWVGGEDKREQLRESLLPLLRLPVKRVLVSHGVPILDRGHTALERALASG